jgi:hypothetical protein
VLELIALVCAAGMIVWVPVESHRVARGWVRRRHTGTPEEFRALYRRQLTLFVWMGVVFGLINLGLGVLEETAAGFWIKTVTGVLWFGAGAAALYGRRVVDAAPR